jgi:murein DD-endopeptidase MepM/ murein hydrolase activator NlpD
MIIPAKGDRVRRIRLNRWLIGLVCTLISISVGLSGFFTYGYFERGYERTEMQRLQLENSLQRQRLARLMSDLQVAQQDIYGLAEEDARLRQLAGLRPQGNELPVAMGGFPEIELLPDGDPLARQIRQLRLDIKLRRQSQEGIHSLLNDRASWGRSTPSGWPTRGWLSSYFGKRKDPYSGQQAMHEGLDIAAYEGTPVHATADGVVSRVDYLPNFGKILTLDHGYGYQTLFAHLSKILVNRGDRIKRGDRIALVGNTGRSTGSHLHYELRLNDVLINPRKFL